MKICCRCKIKKSKSEFGTDKHMKDGLNSKCKKCCREYEKIRCAKPDVVAKKKSQDAKRYHSNPIKHRERKLVDKYALSVTDYNYILGSQNFVCAICSCKPDPNGAPRQKYLCVDHCHETGKIRGLLCYNCNLALGNLKDNPQLLRRAATYLEDYPTYYGNVG